MLHLDLLGAVVEDRRLDRPLEELVRMAAEELVERVLAGDVDGEARGAAAARPHIWRRLATVPGKLTQIAASSSPTSIPSSSASVAATASSSPQASWASISRRCCGV